MRHGAVTGLGLLWWLGTAAPAAAQRDSGEGAQPARPRAEAPLRSRVWVNTDTKVYHCPGSALYGQTKGGEYMTEAQARARGNRAARGDGCDRKGVPAKSVWVNTASGIYFCRGHQNFGTTKEGRFMMESAAEEEGYRPAGGKRCR